MRPGTRLLQALLLWATLGLLPSLAWLLMPALAGPTLLVWLIAGLALAVLAAADLQRVRHYPAPHAERHLPAALSVGVSHPVEIRLDTATLPGRILLADHHPGDDHHTGLPRRLTLPGEQAVAVLRYRYRPTQRGAVTFGDIELWLPSPAGLWEQRRRVPARCQVPVYPDFSPIARAALAVHNTRKRFGQRPRPRTGEGLEFQELRDYQPGDSPRRIDWKASARHRNLITRHFRDEQNQTVWVLLDGGRRMALPIGNLSAFDHGLNATLLLAWSALRQNDRVGALLFAGEQSRWLEPVRGQHGTQALLRRFYDAHPGDEASDFSRAARHFHHRCRRRALVVLITRLQPEDSDDLLAAVRLLGKRHQVLVADLQLPELQALHQQPVDDLDSALQLAAHTWEQQQRSDLHVRLRHAGARLVTATPERLAERLGHAYQRLSSGQAP